MLNKISNIFLFHFRHLFIKAVPHLRNEFFNFLKVFLFDFYLNKGEVFFSFLHLPFIDVDNDEDFDRFCIGEDVCIWFSSDESDLE